MWYRHRPSKSGPMVVQVTEGYTVRVFQSAFFTPDMDCVYMDCPKSPIHQFDIHRTSWLAEAGAHYIILVHTDYPIAIQTFEVSLWYNDVPMFPYGPIDVTGNAQVLPGTFSRGSSLSASSYDTPIATASTGAASHSTTNNHFIAMPSCGTATPQSTVGAWYTVHGNGEEAIALTCGLTSIDTQISVFVHDTPWEDQLDILHHQLSTGQLLDQDTLTSFIDSLQCVDGNDDSCSSTQSQVSWSTEVGKLYFVLVHGHVEDTNHTEPFEISFFDGSPQNVLDGDFCVNAIDANDAVFVVVENEYDPTKNIVPHEEVLFDNCYLTKFVSFDGVEDRDIGSLDGCYNEWTYPRDGSVPSGLWYRVDGTGGTFRVRMACIDDPGYGETGTSVLTHPKALGGLGCGQLECVTDTCNDECEFQTTEDNVYYIFIFTFPEVFCSSPTLHFHIIDSQ
uniref:Uncharacterized protein n=1 Tax=Craspedostauros australis TaxID=1486917 RepID=A0A7R9ZRI7_9STRA